jgi:hypothetical protein
VGDVLDVKAAGGDVRRGQQSEPVVLEGEHHAIALALTQVSVERLDLEPAAAKRLVEPRRADLRAAEDDRLLGILGSQHLDEAIDLAPCGHLYEGLLDCVDGDLLRGHLDRDGVVHIAVGEPLDRGRDGGREQRGLPAGGAEPQDALDLVDKAEIEHFVGLVEDDVAGSGEVQGAARDQVQRSPHGRHHDLGARSKPRLLRLDGLASEHSGDLNRQVLGVGPERLGHLDAELTGRRQDQRLGVARVRIDVLEHRQPEGRRLARPRLRLADHIVTGEQRGNGLFLNRRRVGVAELVEGLGEPVRKPQLAKGGH